MPKQHTYKRPPARPRHEVEALCPTPVRSTTVDCRGEHYDNPNTSGAMFGVKTGRYDSLAVRSDQANRARQKREWRAVERSFAYEGLGVRQSGRDKRVDPDAGPSRLERDKVDAAVRSGGAGRKAAAAPKASTYNGKGTTYGHEAPPVTRVTRKAPGAKRAKGLGDLGPAQLRRG